MEQAYKRVGYQSPISTTDIIIEYGGLVKPKNGQAEPEQPLRLVLIERGGFPPGTAICGGFHEWGLTGLENACKEAKEETNLEVVIKNARQPFVYDAPDRDPRGHMISHTYIGVGYGRIKAGDDAKAARLYTIDEVKSLVGTGRFAFDHEKILLDYLEHKGLMEKR